jgi:hypothetical protein
MYESGALLAAVSSTNGLGTGFYIDSTSQGDRYFNAEVSIIGAANPNANTAYIAHSLSYDFSATDLLPGFSAGFYGTTRTDTHIRFKADQNHTGGKIYVYGIA